MASNPDEPYEFTCIDCGQRVVQLIRTSANEQDICATCSFLRDVERPEDREGLRAFLRMRGGDI